MTERADTIPNSLGGHPRSSVDNYAQINQIRIHILLPPLKFSPILETVLNRQAMRRFRPGRRRHIHK